MRIFVNRAVSVNQSWLTNTILTVYIPTQFKGGLSYLLLVPHLQTYDIMTNIMTGGWEGGGRRGPYISILFMEHPHFYFWKLCVRHVLSPPLLWRWKCFFNTYIQ